MPVDFVCPHCGHQTLVGDEHIGRTGPCAGCGEGVTVPRPGHPFAAGGPLPPRNLGSDPAVRMLLPVGRSGWAIAAGYAGLFALLFFPAPIALILGIVAIRDIRRHSDRHGMGRAVFGVVMGTLGTIGLLVGITAVVLGA